MEDLKEKEMNPEESLAVISSMINTAKNRLADDGFYFIMWGWLVFIAAISNYVFVLAESKLGGVSWAILMPLGAIISLIYGRRQNKREKVTTYIDRYLGHCWIAFAGALVLTLLFMDANGFRSSYFFLMLLYGMATLISGGLLNFKPLIIGSVFSFACAILAMFVRSQELFLCIAAAIFCSYIVPGYLLKSRYTSQEHV